MAKRGILTLILISLWDQGYGNATYMVSLKNKGNPKLQLSWNVDYENQIVNFVLRVSTQQPISSYPCVIGIGMSDRGEVLNADIIIMWYSLSGINMQDSWSDRSGRISADSHQDYHLQKYDINSDGASISFGRPIVTNDQYDYILDNGTTNMFYLLEKKIRDKSADETPSDNKVFSEDVSKMSEHTTLNSLQMDTEITRVQILKPYIPSSYFGSQKEENPGIFSLLQPNFTIPSQITTYWCSVGKIPDDIRGKFHGIGFGANITGKSKEIVHHMEVYLCDPKDGDMEPFSGICNSGIQLRPDVQRCDRVVGAWAKGAADFFYPKEAGIPFGQSGESRYFRLEIHYHNPKKLAGIVDSSGINFYYTKNLRKYDAGIVEVGLTYNHNLGIPPQERNFVLKGFCPSKCTREGLNPDGIEVFASQLHTHLTGRKVWISQYRRGLKMSEINRDNHYSGLFQEIRHIYPPAKVIPGDSLITSCSYNTMDRNNFTKTGDSIFEEMCVSYLHYYPLSQLEVCKSSISSSTLAEFFLLQKLFQGNPEPIDFLNLGENYDQLKWSNELREELIQTYDEGPQDIECRNHEGQQLKGEWLGMDIEYSH